MVSSLFHSLRKARSGLILSIFLLPDFLVFQVLFIEFRDYGIDEMVEIVRIEAARHELTIEDDVASAIDELLRGLPEPELVGNGRLARNLFEKMYEQMAVRVGADGVITDEELRSGFAVEDVPESAAEEEFEIPGYL